MFTCPGDSLLLVILAKLSASFSPFIQSPSTIFLTAWVPLDSMHCLEDYVISRGFRLAAFEPRIRRPDF